MAALYDIVGYIYCANIWCGACVIDAVRESHRATETETYFSSFESELKFLADRFGFDYEDEYSYDSDDFPKVIFRDQIENTEYCNDCHSRIE